jgi:hypothetical protein
MGSRTEKRPTFNKTIKMRALKTILFHLLRTFRGIVLLGCKILSGVFLIGFILMLLIGSGHQGAFGMKLTFLVFAVGFGALAWYYDMLILKLKPDNVDLVLFQ